MPIDLSAVNWAYVGVLTALAFVTALLGSLIAFRNRFAGSIIAAVLFAVGYVFWTYYPHPNIPGPISPGPLTSVVAPAPSSTAPADSDVTPAPAPSAPNQQ